MNKSILIKGSIIMGFFLVIIGAAVGCSLIRSDATEPTLTNGDSVYFTTDDFTVTNSELFEVMKNVDGLSYLNEYVDRILLADEIAKVTQVEVDTEIKYLTYKTNSESLIALIQEDPAIAQVYIDAFEQNLVVLGFDPASADDLRTYTEVGIAKTKLARQYMLDATGDNIYAISDEDVQEYYESVTYGDVCALDVRFKSAAEATLVFEKYMLIPSLDLGDGTFGIGLYTENAVIPFKDVDSDGFVLGENTRALTDLEVREYFIKMYNEINPWKTPIPEDVSNADLCTTFAEETMYNFDDMITDRGNDDPYVALATYIFQTLTLDLLDEDGIFYSYAPQPFADTVSYIYKLSEAPITAYDDLTADDIAELKEDILDLIVTSENIESIVDSIYEDIDFEIYDPYLALNYKFDMGVTFDNKGSETLIATIGDVDITADDLFDFMQNRVGAFYSVELAKIDHLLSSDAYFDAFGNDYDYLNSNNDKLEELRDELREMKSTFAGNGYATYNLSSDNYSWEEFMYLAFNVKTESLVIERIYVMQDLQNSIIYPSLSYNNSANYIQTQFDEYFSLNVEHLFLYLDLDNDYNPDDLDEYVAGLTPAELVEFTAARSAFDDLVFERLDVGISIDDIVKEYEDSLFGDPLNAWADVKAYGFQIRVENLTAPDAEGVVTSLNNNNIDALDPVFATRLKSVYDIFINLDANTTDGLDEYLDTQIVQSSVGIHIILATKGSGFEKFSAQYDPTADTSIVYSDGSANDNDLPNEAQIAIYNRIVFATIGGDATLDILPPDVYQSIEQLYAPLFHAHFTQSGYSIVTMNAMLDANISFTNDNADRMASLQDILDVLILTSYSEDYIVID